MKHWFTNLSLSIFALGLAASSAMAQEDDQVQWYEVEVILFEHLNPDALTAEQWPLKPGHPTLDKLIELLRPDQISEPTTDEAMATDTITETTSETGIGASTNIPEQPYLILPADQYQMQEHYNKLVESENYLPLLHTAWRQVIPERKTPDNIHLHSNIEKISSIRNDAAETASFSTVSPMPLTSKDPALNGVLSLGLGRYIHVDVDFMFKNPGLVDIAMPETTNFFDANLAENLVLDNASEERPDMFRIQGNLRLPSGEIHYLDHPMVGMMILFTRYTPPAIEAEVDLETEIEDKPEPPLAPL